jgi:hypothetical protein
VEGFRELEGLVVGGCCEVDGFCADWIRLEG